MTGDAASLRAFVALPFESEARAALALLAERLQALHWADSVRWVRPANLHLTLRFLGDIPQAAVVPLLGALATSVSDISAFRCRLGSAELFPTAARPRVVAVGLAETAAPGKLARLAECVEAAVVAAGCEPEARPFRGHVTLGRIRSRRQRLALPRDLAFESKPVEVSHVVLFRSELGARGPRYTELGRAPLAGSGGEEAGR